MEFQIYNHAHKKIEYYTKPHQTHLTPQSKCTCLTPQVPALLCSAWPGPLTVPGQAPAPLFYFILTKKLSHASRSLAVHLRRYEDIYTVKVVQQVPFRVWLCVCVCQCVYIYYIPRQATPQIN
jgi:hypothetical protein